MERERGGRGGGEEEKKKKEKENGEEKEWTSWEKSRYCEKNADINRNRERMRSCKEQRKRKMGGLDEDKKEQRNTKGHKLIEKKMKNMKKDEKV